MASDLPKLLETHASLLVTFSRYIVGIISDDTLTVEQAQRAYESVELVYRSFDEVAKEVKDRILEGPLVEAAAQIEKAWLSLFDVTTARLRILQGLPPIEDTTKRRNDA